MPLNKPTPVNEFTALSQQGFDALTGGVLLKGVQFSLDGLDASAIAITDATCTSTSRQGAPPTEGSSPGSMQLGAGWHSG